MASTPELKGVAQNVNDSIRTNETSLTHLEEQIDALTDALVSVNCKLSSALTESWASDDYILNLLYWKIYFSSLLLSLTYKFREMSFIHPFATDSCLDNDYVKIFKMKYNFKGRAIILIATDTVMVYDYGH